MAKKLKEAMERNRLAAQDLDDALRECLRDLREASEPVAEGRFRVITGGRRREVRQGR